MFPHNFEGVSSDAPKAGGGMLCGRTTEFFAAASMRRSVAKWNAAFMRQNGVSEEICPAPMLCIPLKI